MGGRNFSCDILDTDKDLAAGAFWVSMRSSFFPKIITLIGLNHELLFALSVSIHGQRVIT